MEPLRRPFAELVGTLEATAQQKALGHTTNPGFRLGDIDYLRSLWDTAGYKDGLIHKDNLAEAPGSGRGGRGDNWLARDFLGDVGQFGRKEYQSALDAGYTAAQIYQAIPHAIGPKGTGKGLRNIDSAIIGEGGAFYKDLIRDRGTWLTGYQNTLGTFGERSYDELREHIDAGTEVGHGPDKDTRITPKAIWDAREGVNRIGPRARQLLMEDLQQVDPLRHTPTNITTPSTNTTARLSNPGYRVGRSATGIKRQDPSQRRTNRNARGTWQRGSNFFTTASTY